MSGDKRLDYSEDTIEDGFKEWEHNFKLYLSYSERENFRIDISLCTISSFM